MYNTVGGPGACSPGPNASFWHSGTDVCIVIDAVTSKLKGNFINTLKRYFFVCDDAIHSSTHQTHIRSTIYNKRTVEHRF